MIKAVVFDIDGTLTPGVSWLRLSDTLGGSSKELSRIFELFVKDELSYPEAKRQLLEMWQRTGNANRSFFEQQFARWPLQEGAEQFVKYLHAKKCQTALITGSMDMFATAIGMRLAIDNIFYNTTLIWDAAGELLDIDYSKDQATKKQQQFTEFCKQRGLLPTECVVVGDGDSEIPMFVESGLGVAVGEHVSDALAAAAWHRVENLPQVRLVVDPLIGDQSYSA